MGKGIFITGTDTDIGKSFVSATLCYRLKEEGYKVAYFKPVQTGGALDTTYIKFFLDEDHIYNSYTFKEPLSPHLSAKISNVQIDKNKIIDEYELIKNKYDYIIVEGAGGLVAPLIDDTYCVFNLIKDLDMDALLVAPCAIGSINHTILSLEFAKAKDIDIKGIIINNYDRKYYEDDNIDMIQRISNKKVILRINKMQSKDIECIKKNHKNIDTEKILEVMGD